MKHKRAKKMNAGGIVGKKAPDDERPISERLAERDGGSGQGQYGDSGIRVEASGGRSGSSGLSGYAKVSKPIQVTETVSVEPWVSVAGSTRYGRKVPATGVTVTKAFRRGGLIDPRNFKK